MDYENLKEKWRFRFQFFDTSLAPGTPSYQQDLKGLSFLQMIKIQNNFIALFFGPVYFFVLGLWRQNLFLIGTQLLLVVLLAIIDSFYPLPDSIFRGAGIGISFLYAQSANYAYYLQKVKQEYRWNPFAGWQWRSLPVAGN